MTDAPLGARPKPVPATGFRHAASAARYSLAGFRRLLREEAFRQELLALLLVAGLFAAAGAPVRSYATQGLLFLGLAATEALNTAIEVVVDRISPGYADFAREAKDLGSFAVFCLLLANGLHAALVLWQAFF